MSWILKYKNFSFEYTQNIFSTLALLFITNGLAIFSMPWWADLLFKFFGYLEIDITDRNILAISHIILGLALLVIKYLIAENEKKLLHDKMIIENSNIQLESLAEYFNKLLNNHSYKSSKDTLFHRSYNEFKDLFFHKKTKELYRLYREDANRLHNFIAYNFFPYPDIQSLDDYRYSMQPDMKSSSNQEKYNELSKELEAQVYLTKISYETFIKHLKKYYII